jgi:hypothetical protein
VLSSNFISIIRKLIASSTCGVCFIKI